MMLVTSLAPEQTAAYLRTLPAIRERCSRVHALAQEGKLQYFEYHPEKEDAVASFCIDIMKVLLLQARCRHPKPYTPFRETSTPISRL